MDRDQLLGTIFGLVGIGVALVCLAAMLVVMILILRFLSSCFARIPQQFRQQEPGMVWLLLIPCFNLVWNFFVYPKLADSYKAYFDSVGRPEVGDCGKGIGLAYCICVACSIVPYIGVLPALAALVLWIIFLVKAKELRDMIPVA